MKLIFPKGRTAVKSDTNVTVNPHIAPQVQQPLLVFEQAADYPMSMELLAKNGLRPLTYREAFSRSPELIVRLKDKWFWLSAEGIQKNGVFTFNANGELTELTGKEPLDQKVLVYPGNQPSVLNVHSDYDARSLGRRFNLDGDPPSFMAPVVVGIRSADAIISDSKAVLVRLRRNLPR